MEILTPEQIQEITGKKRRPSQLRVLNALGIPAKPRPDGSLLVLASAVEMSCLGNIAGAKMKSKEDEFIWGPG